MSEEPRGSELYRRAEWALHRRATLACAAATHAGVPGHFRTSEYGGLSVVAATDPSLAFLAAISGVTPGNVQAAIDLAGSADWNGVAPAILAGNPESESTLRAAGLTRVADRVLAVHILRDISTVGPIDEVTGDADKGTFLNVLLAGYEVHGVVAAFIRAEHGIAAMRRFLLYARDDAINDRRADLAAGRVPIAAAAMTVHGDVAVLGGAATLPAYRGQGAQSRLVRHRLRLAADAGCALAVATAGPDTVSAANLRKAGFRVYRRSAWRVNISAGRADPRRD